MTRKEHREIVLKEVLPQCELTRKVVVTLPNGKKVAKEITHCGCFFMSSTKRTGVDKFSAFVAKMM